MSETFDGKNPMVIPRAIVNKGGVRAATMTGSETWTLKTSTVQILDPGSSDRTVTLPTAEPALDGARYVVCHSGVASSITLSDGADVAVLTSGEWAEVYCEGTDWYLGAHGDSGTARGLVQVFDDFNRQAVYNTEADGIWILNAGSDDVAVDPAISAVGILTLTSGDAGTGVAADGSQIVCALPVQAQSGGLYMETRLHINTAVTTVQVNVGLTDVTTLELPVSIGGSDALTTNASDFAGFVFDTGADTDEWFMVAVDGDTDDTGSAALGTAPTADTYQTLRVEVDADGATIRFYIDGSLAGTLSGDAGVSPDVNLYATIIVNSTTTTSRTVDVDYIEIGVQR